MSFNIVDILSMGASISTMIGLLIAIVTLWNFYYEKRKKTEYDTKKDFYEGVKWECIGDNKGIGSFSLSLNRAPFFRISGEIDFLDTIDVQVFNIENILFFEVTGVCKKEITLEIHQLKEISEIDLRKEILGRATLKHVTPHEFLMTFSENCLPNFPRTVTLDSYEYYRKLDEKELNKQSINRLDTMI